MAGIKIGRNAAGRIIVIFPYNASYIAKIKSIPGRQWHPEEKCWSLPSDKGILERLLSIFEGGEVDIDPSLKTVEEAVKPASKEINKNTSHNPQIFTEIFPVLTTALPKLFAYRLDAGGQDTSTIGGKLSYRLRKKFKGHWVWATNRIITDTLRTQKEIMSVVEDLWHEQPNVFKNLRDVKQESDWQPTPQAHAGFVANGLLADIEPEIKKILQEKTQDIGNARVERVHDARGWVVQGHPAVSVSISSHLIYKQDLKSYTSSISTPEDLNGLWVVDKTSTLKGEIIGVEGRLGQHRKRLLALTQREEMQEIIENAPDEEPVVRVLSGHNQYEYAVSALRIILRMEDLRRFRVNSQQALKALLIEPGLRSQLVKEVSNLAINRKFVMNAYNSKDSSGMFLNAADVGFTPRLRFGGNRIIQYDEKTLLRNLRDYGLYKVSEKFQHKVPINIGIINALGSLSISVFLSKLQQELQRLNFEVRLVHEEKIQGTSRVDLEKAIGNLQTQNPHILLVFFPEEHGEDEEEWGAYHNLKSLTVGRDIASQVVYQSTLDKQYAMANIVLGVLGKTGNIPFILAEPLPYADIIVGIDIARERKKRLAGSINATAIARIYFSSGEFLRYVIHDAPLEGETIPDNVLQGLFPVSEFKGKRVIIHRDGYFRGEEKQALKGWAQKIGAEFYLVEVIKTGTPRLYGIQGDKILQPPKGSAFKLSDTEAFLVSSLPPFANATPQPLRIRTEAPLTIEQAIHSILSLTLLHYGSLKPPRLPITIHYSDRIAYLALRGIKPKDLEGSLPFWL
ncbi:MAG TPA: Piwi domain-containing protein [candidate division Zixibacteria bacterium]|nr:Piwi domain-containing protein [candidate division Zixibacteria bacterium]